MSRLLAGILAGLASAVIWGSGDFAGGLAARRDEAPQVVTLASFSGFVIALIAAVARQEALPTGETIFWSSVAGLSGGLGIMLFYRALAIGPAGVVAPTAGVTGASVPVFFGILSSGMPHTRLLLGLLGGLAGIWLVSSGSGRAEAGARPLALALLAGIAFGGFFVAFGHVPPGSLFAPLAVAKLSATLLAGGMLALQRRPLFPKTSPSLAILAGILDAGGNLFYLLATQYTRLDIAAVTSSMYPGATVVLAGLLQRERIRPLQSIGIAMCLVAVAVIAAG
ncbi:MAG TPA: EamA family transporter [Anaerolineales bacterium]|nr:EamA family transporter [Anaerolineales bacterium]